MDEVRAQMQTLEKKTGKTFGAGENPLLISVRSGSAMSMPGMMDTILNLGLNIDTLKGLIAQTGNERFGWDAYRRFIQLFGKVAMGVPDEAFDTEFEAVKEKAGAKEDVALTARDLREISDRFLEMVERETGNAFPDDPMEQLEVAVKAVFDSWGGKRAVDYRREFNITPDMANGTAVNLCTMVFGNLGEDCATGVSIDMLEAEMPAMYQELQVLRERLEAHYHEVQDFEFTIEKGRFYCLQTRNGKMNTTALVRTSVDMTQCVSSPTCWNSCCFRAWTQPLYMHRWRVACPPHPARQPDTPCSTPIVPNSRGTAGSASSWCARKPNPKTSTAFLPHRVF
jgi:pyruvate,orthophosphate dikinase